MKLHIAAARSLCAALPADKSFTTVSTETEARKGILCAAHEVRKTGVRESQVRVYNDLLQDNRTAPTKRQWMDACRSNEISSEISRSSSPFPNWNALEREATSTNHRVVSVTLDGAEDVFTGTVDESHTFFSIGCEREDSKGRVQMSYVQSFQCGEIILRPWELCNLSIVVARAWDTVETLKQKVRIASIFGTLQSCLTTI